MFIRDFGIAASVIVMQLEKTLSTSIVTLHSYLGEEFVILLQMGFFVLTGDRYQMCIPRAPRLSVVKAALLKHASTQDEECCLHPEHLVVTLSRTDAKAWQARVRAIGEPKRAADRFLLLELERNSKG
jgi:hypothetical protein